ncbi:MAG: hypothetical protein WDO72_14760 [Pseudomonadota bacterium]
MGLALSVVPLVIAAAENPPSKTRVLIAPECKSAYFLLGIPSLPGGITRSTKPVPDYVEWDPSVAKPLTFKDLRTQVTFYVESDGRHLAAIDSQGKILWVRNPFEDSKLCPYRTPRPIIYRIEEADSPLDADAPGNEIWLSAFRKRGMDPSHGFIRIHFDSSQFGLVDISNGAFLMEGQN